MFRSLVNVSIVALTAATVSACAHKNKTEVVGEAAVQSKAEEVAEQRGEHMVSRIAFEKGQSTLSSGARQEITHAITEARKMGEIDDVTVAVWSDMAYPDTNRKLPKNQVALANKRGDRIENYLAKDMHVSKTQVKVHNMGEKPGYFAEFLNTSDNRLKTDLIAKGITEKEGVMNYDRATSSALIFIKLK